jgi:hypothetical protein
MQGAANWAATILAVFFITFIGWIVIDFLVEVGLSAFEWVMRRKWLTK